MQKHKTVVIASFAWTAAGKSIQSGFAALKEASSMLQNRSNQIQYESSHCCPEID